MEAMLERIAKRKAASKLPPKSSMNPQAALDMLNKEPTQENIYGQLRDISNPEVPVTRTLPIKEAMNTYMKNPESYTPLPPGPPVLRHIYPTTPGGPMDASALGEGIANERMIFQHPVPSNIRSVQSSINKELLGGNEPLGNVGEFEKRIVEKEVGKPRAPEGSIGDVLTMSSKLEDIWQATGGGRSTFGSLWRQYLNGSNLKGKIKTPKDYFIASAIKEHNSPSWFAKQYPREKKLLDTMRSVYKERIGVDFTTGK